MCGLHGHNFQTSSCGTFRRPKIPPSEPWVCAPLAPATCSTMPLGPHTRTCRDGGGAEAVFAGPPSILGGAQHAKARRTLSSVSRPTRTGKPWVSSSASLPRVSHPSHEVDGRWGIRLPPPSDSSSFFSTSSSTCSFSRYFSLMCWSSGRRRREEALGAAYSSEMRGGVDNVDTSLDSPESSSGLPSIELMS